MKEIILGLFLALQVSSVLACEPYIPPDNGGPDSEHGTGTRLQDDCLGRGTGRRDCLFIGVN